MRATGAQSVGRCQWVFLESMTLWAATASCSIGLVGHICNIQYTNMLYHYTFVYVFVFFPKTLVFHGIQVHTPGAANDDIVG